MNLAEPQTLRSFLDRHGLFARKGLGQHFLCSAKVVGEILRRVEDYKSVFEIGPGPGVLTSALAASGRQVLALEIDPAMVAALRESAPEAEVVKGDALKADLGELLSGLPQPCAVVSNLPYYITGPLIQRIADARVFYSKAVLMMQAEVADRILASSGDGRRGSLSVYLQALFGISFVARAPASGFLPPPKVDSIVLELVPLRDEGVSEEFFRFVREGFSQPRKTLANNLLAFGKEMVQSEVERCGLSPTVRPHELSLEDWKRLWSGLAQ